MEYRTLWDGISVAPWIAQLRVAPVTDLPTKTKLVVENGTLIMAKFRENFLLSNPHIQGVRRELTALPFVRARFDHRLGIDWWVVHSRASACGASASS